MKFEPKNHQYLVRAGKEVLYVGTPERAFAIAKDREQRGEKPVVYGPRPVLSFPVK